MISGFLHYFPVACSVTFRSDGSVLLCGNSTPFKSSNPFEFCDGPLALVHKWCRRPAADTATVVERRSRPQAMELLRRRAGRFVNRRKCAARASDRARYGAMRRSDRNESKRKGERTCAIFAHERH